VGRYHTRTYRGKPGFKTLVKPSKEACQRQLEEMREVIRQYKGAPRAALVKALNPKIRGWTQYHCASIAKKTFDWMDAQLFHELYRWSRFRHPRKTGGWCVSRYWKQRGNRQNFGDGTMWLVKYADTPIKRHIKVRGDKSPGACPEACPERSRRGGNRMNNRYANLVLLHGHCHDEIHGKTCQ